MKAAKNAVLKYSPYTAALTRSLKATERLHCRVNEGFPISGYPEIDNVQSDLRTILNG